MSKIFVSYSRKDTIAVEELVAHLEEAGHDVWRDREVVGGQDWWRMIVSQIRGGDIFLVALSSACLDSAACSAELRYASDLHKLVLPVRIADGFSPAMMNSLLARTQIVDYYPPTVAAAIRLMRAINDLPAPNPIPVPEPSPPPAPLSYVSALRDRLDSVQPLTEAEQGELVLTLRRNCRNVNEVGDARALLKLVRSRPELYARFADDIDETLRSTEPTVEPHTEPHTQPHTQPHSEARAEPPNAAPTGGKIDSPGLAPPSLTVPVRSASTALTTPSGSPRAKPRRRGLVALGVACLSLLLGGVGVIVALQQNNSDPPAQTDDWATAASAACREHLPALSRIGQSQSATTFAELADELAALGSALDQLEGAPSEVVEANLNLRAAISGFLNAQEQTNNGAPDDATVAGAEALDFLNSALGSLSNGGASDCNT